MTLWERVRNFEEVVNSRAILIAECENATGVFHMLHQHEQWVDESCITF